MKKIGITGQNGFIGYHLYHTLKMYPEEFELIEFDRSFFENEIELNAFVIRCDVVVHLAALNRHNNPDEIYRKNIGLVEKLIEALESTNSSAHVIVSSTTQEEHDNLYGKSKKKGRLLLSEWSNKSSGHFSGMIIPNVYGPFGHPFYNSVVATFCHQISHNQKPTIDVDGQLRLIYVGELVEEIIMLIRKKDNTHALDVSHTAEAKVSEILNLLQYYRHTYQNRGEIPVLNNYFEHKLFNTYRCYMDIQNYFPRHFVQHTDDRGAFVEISRQGISGQTSFSTTVPGVTRGNHYHTRKIERFAVIKGKALIQLRRVGTKKVHNFYLDGEEPAFVDMPIWYTHSIKNIGEDTLYTIFWIDEPYDHDDSDTWFEAVSN